MINPFFSKSFVNIVDEKQVVMGISNTTKTLEFKFHIEEEGGPAIKTIQHIPTHNSYKYRSHSDTCLL